MSLRTKEALGLANAMSNGDEIIVADADWPRDGDGIAH